MIANVRHILAIEWLAAAQGIDFLRPLASSGPLEAAHAMLREQCPTMAHDRFLAPEIEAAGRMVADGTLARILHALGERPALWTAE
jgi:histidine ammonia-lyase